MGKYNHLNFISVLFLDFFEYKIIDLLDIITKIIIFSIIALYIQIITILIRVI